MFNDTVFYTNMQTQREIERETQTWIMAACISPFPFPCGAAKALEAVLIRSTSTYISSKILERRLSI